MITRRHTRAIVWTVIILFMWYLLTFSGKKRHSIINIKDNNNGKVDISEAHFDTKSIKYVPAENIIQNYKSMQIEAPDKIKWDKLAYVFYVTDEDQLLPILINIKQLRKFKTRANIELICSFNIENISKEKNPRLSNMVKLLKERYFVKINLVKPIRSKFLKDSTNWSDSFTKLYAFSLTHLDRIIYLDGDSIIYKHMDQLFTLPPSLLALPVNYIKQKDLYKQSKNWFDNNKLDEIPPTPFEYSLSVQDFYKKIIENELEFNNEYFFKFYNNLPSMELSLSIINNIDLSSYFMVIMPNEKVFEWILTIIDKKGEEEYDMEIINKIWDPYTLLNNNYFINDKKEPIENEWLNERILPSLMIIPHYPYGLLSREFRHKLDEHSSYLTSPVDYSYLNSKNNKLINERIKNSKESEEFLNIGDVVEIYPNIGYWDWSWRFNYDGSNKNLFDFLKFSNENNNNNDDYNNEIEVGMGVDRFGWESKKIMNDASYIHWSDWPLGKPWQMFEINDNDNENENDENSSDWIFEKISEQSLNECINDINEIFDNLKSGNMIQLDKERKFSIKTCKDSIDSWKLIYTDYKNIMISMEKEISMVK